MKNLNSSYTHSNINFNADIRSRLDTLLAVCENCNTDISHVYLTEKDAYRLMRNISALLFYQYKFNEIGIELICPSFVKEAQNVCSK